MPPRVQQLVKLSPLQLKTVAINRAEIFNTVARHVPNSSDARYVLPQLSYFTQKS